MVPVFRGLENLTKSWEWTSVPHCAKEWPLKLTEVLSNVCHYSCSAFTDRIATFFHGPENWGPRGQSGEQQPAGTPGEAPFQNLEVQIARGVWVERDVCVTHTGAYQGQVLPFTTPRSDKGRARAAWALLFQALWGSSAWGPPH